MNITFIEEDINKTEIKKILDVYFDTTDENYKKGLQEITPFDGAPFQKRIYKFISYFGIRRVLKSNKNAFVYRLALITGIKKSNKNFLYLKGCVNGEPKVFFSISRKSIKSRKNISIDKMISIKKGLGEKVLKDLCDYYNIYNIVVQPSIYGVGFWEKMKTRYKGKINITILN